MDGARVGACVKLVEPGAPGEWTGAAAVQEVVRLVRIGTAVAVVEDRVDQLDGCGDEPAAPRAWRRAPVAHVECVALVPCVVRIEEREGLLGVHVAGELGRQVAPLA